MVSKVTENCWLPMRGAGAFEGGRVGIMFCRGKSYKSGNLPRTDFGKYALEPAEL